MANSNPWLDEDENIFVDDSEVIETPIKALFKDEPNLQSILLTIAATSGLSELVTSLSHEYKSILDKEATIHHQQTAFYKTYPGDDDATPEQIEKSKSLNLWESQNYEKKMEIESRLKLALGNDARDFESATSAQHKHSVSFPNDGMEIKPSPTGTENSQRNAEHSSE